MNKTRVAILGTGTIVREYHLPALLENERCEVVALGNLHPQSLEELASAHGISKTYTDFAAMAQDSGIDAVLNALPNYLHAQPTIQLLEAGKHVLCEKPMAMNVAEAEAMIAAADKAGRKLGIAHVWRSSEEYRWLREVVASGALGTIYKVRVHSVAAGGGPKPGSWFVQPEFAGGGAFADIGVHGLDNVAFVFGDRLRPRMVFARMSARFRPIEVEDTAAVMVEYADGLVATVEAGWHHRYSDNPHGAIELYGTEGYARTFPSEVRSTVGGRWGAWCRGLGPTLPAHIEMQMYRNQIDQFLDFVTTDAAPVCDARHALPTMRVLQAAYQSAQSGQSVSLEAAN